MNIQWVCLSFKNAAIEKGTQKKTDTICPHHSPLSKKRGVFADSLSDLDFFFFLGGAGGGEAGKQTKTQINTNLHLFVYLFLYSIILSINLNIKTTKKPKNPLIK